MMRVRLRQLTPIVVLFACGGSKPTVAETTPPTPVSPSLPDTAQRPSERLGPSPDRNSAMLVADGRFVAGSRFVVMLDDAVGPQFTKEGQIVTASVVAVNASPGTQLMPAGTKVHMRARMVQSASSGTFGIVYLVPRTLESNGIIYPVNARIIGVVLRERAEGRPVNVTGTSVAGTIVPKSELSPVEREKDLLGRGTAISVGGTSPDAQLNKGTGLELELRGPIPLSLWEPAAKPDVAIGWIRDLLPALEQENDVLVGQRMSVHSVLVESVIGDVVWWVGPSKMRRMLVVMDKEGMDTPESKTIIKKGQIIDVEGVVEAMPPKEIAPYLWAMVTAKEAAEFTPHPIYLFATHIKVVVAEEGPAKAKTVKEQRHKK
jgi:hypothetical protein